MSLAGSAHTQNFRNTIVERIFFLCQRQDISFFVLNIQGTKERTHVASFLFYFSSLSGLFLLIKPLAIYWLTLFKLEKVISNLNVFDPFIT